jgi:predicted nucleic acid-binding protein
LKKRPPGRSCGKQRSPIRLLDANVIVHAFVDQDQRARERSRALLKRIEGGDEEVLITELVLAEVASVLGTRRGGGLPRSRIGEILTAIVTLPGVQLEAKAVWLEIIGSFARENVDLADAQFLWIAEHRGCEEIHSYDTDFDRLPGVKRLEP